MSSADYFRSTCLTLKLALSLLSNTCAVCECVSACFVLVVVVSVSVSAVVDVAAE